MLLQVETVGPPEGSIEAPIRYWTKYLVYFIFAWALGLLLFSARPLDLISRNWPFIFVGFGGAVLGNISAVGGGIVFIPAIMFIFHLPPVTALKAALGSQSFGMTSGAIGWLQKKIIPLDALRMTVPGLLIGSTIGSLVIHPSALLVKLFFGPVSILLGVLAFLRPPDREPTIARGQLPPRAAVPLFLISMIGGMITGWVAIGEGELVAAWLMLAYGMDAAACIGLGVLLLAINSLYLTLIHSLFLGGIPWEIASFTGLGCVFGARLSPFLSRHIPSRLLRILFGIIAVCDGSLFVFQYFRSTR